MNPKLQEMIAGWRLRGNTNTEAQIAALLEQAQAARLLRTSACAVLLGEQYHLGGAQDTRRMAEALGIAAEDRVLDLACYIGGPARHLARDYGCRVTGVDLEEDYIAAAERLTQLCGLQERVRFLCCDAAAIPLPDGSFTVAWSQGSFPADLSWLGEIHRLLKPGGRVAFSGQIRRSPESDPKLLSLEEVAARTRDFGFRVIRAEDISEFDLEYGWYPLKRKLRENDAHYTALMGEAWVRQAYADLDIDTEAWRSGREGNGRVVAVRE